MKAHELGKRLSEGPDLDIVIPTYSDESGYWYETVIAMSEPKEALGFTEPVIELLAIND